MAPASAGDAPRADLALLGDELAQRRDVLVVDLLDLVAAVLAGLAPPAARPALPVTAAKRLAAPACLGHQRPIPPGARPSCVLTAAGKWISRSSKGYIVIARGGGRCRLEVPFVDRRLAARRSTVAGRAIRKVTPRGGVFARAQELHRVGDDIRCLPFAAVLRLP